jgi:hypothetical protein
MNGRRNNPPVLLSYFFKILANPTLKFDFNFNHIP